MNYEQKYKEALERCKSWMKGEHPECFSEAQKAAEFIFPELKESEDEKIRKAIIEHYRGMHSAMFPLRGLSREEYIAWLEKQGEQKYTEKQDYSGLNDFERAIHRGFLCAGMENVSVTIIKETAKDCINEIKSLETGCEK